MLVSNQVEPALAPPPLRVQPSLLPSTSTLHVHVAPLLVTLLPEAKLRKYKSVPVTVMIPPAAIGQVGKAARREPPQPVNVKAVTVGAAANTTLLPVKAVLLGAP